MISYGEWYQTEETWSHRDIGDLGVNIWRESPHSSSIALTSTCVRHIRDKMNTDTRATAST